MSVADIAPANPPGTSWTKGRDRPAGPRLVSSGFAANAAVDRADGLVEKTSLRLTAVPNVRFGVGGGTADGTATTVIDAVLARRVPAPEPAPPNEPATPPDNPK